MTAPVPEPLIDVTYLRTRHPDRAFDDAQASTLIAEVSAAIRSYCGWHLVPSVTDDVTVDGSGSTILLLPTTHLTAVTAITEDGEPVDVEGVEWSTAGYLRRSLAWTTTLRGVVISLVHGYATPPDELRAVMAAAVVRALFSPLGGVTSEQVGAVSRQYARDAPTALLSADEQAVLARRYCVHPVAA